MTYQVVITTEFWIDEPNAATARSKALEHWAKGDRGDWEITFVGKPVFENGGVVDYEDVTDGE
jgi:hypothetical protein